MDAKLRTTASRLLRAVIEVAAHAAMVIVVIGLFHLVQLALEFLGGGKDVRFFDVIPLRFIIDGADLLMLVGILSVGVYNGVQAYRGKE